jgi:alpha-galactosidase
MLEEIDVAARMGIDVFVIDTGWYVKTGDWQVNPERFDEALRTIRERLARHGMKLGLWFDPTAAAVTSRMAQRHMDCRQVRDGKLTEPHAIWETEESYTLCLVSRYADAFADELIRLVREVGVTYFKWDAITQYACEAAGHFHGTDDNSSQERRECFAFELVRAMGRVVDKLVAACPEAIVDFDVTEHWRALGLGFLASGKFFLINNGPYYRNFDVPVPPPGNNNMFFWPGPARTWICRTPLSYDRWIPSVLLLTHYFPDDPPQSQRINIASLILGQNGIWANLKSVSDEGVEWIGQVLRLYKQVADEITAADPLREGAVGASPEVHEKIAPVGRGAICLFANARGSYRYISQRPVADNFWASDGAEVSIDSAGRAVIDVAFEGPDAAIVLFGITDGGLTSR